MIRLPPADPVAKYSEPLERNSTMVGEMEERGLLPGRMKFAGEGMKPNALEEFGMEKSFISLFIITPVSGMQSWELGDVRTVSEDSVGGNMVPE